MRPSKREFNQLREISIQTNVNKYAEGSCLINWGKNQILCTATIENKVPPFLRNSNKGWITAEYSMLPRSTHSRNQRDSNRKSPNGRGLEIQRLIGRSLRSIVDLKKLGERQIIIDCDVLQADGGTRCASITGGYIALKLAINKLLKDRIITSDPITQSLLAVSCGIFKSKTILDLDYDEDSNCEADVNFIVTKDAKIIEIQGTGEEKPFDFTEINAMYEMVQQAALEISQIQENAINA
ncbi:ribonuclease PH [Rickettsiales bacterium]|nr:ribonuclease PH [Rickettsiales bacterium]